MTEKISHDSVVYVVVEMLNRVPQGVYTSLLEASKAHRNADWHQLTPWHWRAYDARYGRLEVVKFFLNQGLKK